MKHNNIARKCAAAAFVGGFLMLLAYSPAFAEEVVPNGMSGDSVHIFDETDLCEEMGPKEDVLIEETTLEDMPNESLPTNTINEEDNVVPVLDGKELCEEIINQEEESPMVVNVTNKDIVDEGVDAEKTITQQLKPVDGNKPWYTTIDQLVSPTKYEDENKLLKNYAKNIIGNPIDNIYTLIPGYGFLKTAPDDLADTAKAAKDVAKANGVWNTTKAVANLVDKGASGLCDAIPGGGYVKKVKNVAIGTVSYGVKKVTKLLKKWF